MKSWLSRLVNPTVTSQLSNRAEESFTDLPLASERSNQAAVPNRQELIVQLQQSCQKQLELLRFALKLKTAALLWVGPESSQLSLYTCSSGSINLNYGPYPLGIGMTGILKEQAEFRLAPVRDNSPAIPYYPSNKGIGSFIAMRLLIPGNDGYRGDSLGILCADREITTGWSKAEHNLVAMTAEQLISNIQMTRQMLDSDRKRHAYHRALDGVRKLNTSLGLNSTFAATAEAIHSVVPADFLAISLAEGEQHRVAYAEGEKSALLAEQSFPLEQGVVGQVLKYSRTLPENADYRGTLPVFSEAHLFADYRSLMIVPLRREEGPAIGALIVAARQIEAFSQTCRQILELVATQVAIKIDLANLHEQINRMATIDTLTGIANRRAYQRGFEAMFDRAKRRSSALYLILCDIDHFKKINDSFGHPAGDQVLRQVAKQFNQVVRAIDLAARTGGEEFAILLEGTDKKGAWMVAERLRKLIEGLEMKFLGKRVAVTISLGIAAFPQDANTMEKLVSCADRALYQAKASGRNRSVHWNKSS